MTEQITRKEPKALHWTDAAQGNKWMQRISPAMLVGEGMPEPRFIKVPGGIDKEMVRVFYDREYVYAKIVNELMNQMNFDTLQRCLLFMCDVWEFWRRDAKEVETLKPIREFLEGVVKPVVSHSPIETKTWVLRGEKVVKLTDFKVILAAYGGSTKELKNVLVCK